MALQRTGGAKTDEVLGRNGGGPEGLPHSIIVTAEGVEGEVPEPVGDAPAASPDAPEPVGGDEKAIRGKARGKIRPVKGKAKAKRPARRGRRGKA
jgi:DNA topoisomerase-6 subunit B